MGLHSNGKEIRTNHLHCIIKPNVIVLCYRKTFYPYMRLYIKQGILVKNTMSLACRYHRKILVVEAATIYLAFSSSFHKFKNKKINIR